ncbi:ABC transporter ATP-binding protein [Paenibacillus sp. sptzw28]|uniref:ABC transporter ATP-binding protein n=1 Tax=Paenibacillus sp. sptzw28 TaxID=715179 RepID=UPI001C6EC682|nr:ABC transporter ATP-binding protein [Paenibacillus sp. sptzw28]QYR19349.1 ABC transporter ATP-binding protein [Paenibacillus sp. sptzw28]
MEENVGKLQVDGTMTVLQGKEIYRFYHAGEEETLALKGVNIEVGQGEWVAVMGPSGSGKSSLISILAGLDIPDGGHVTLRKQHITRLPETERSAARANNMGIMLQSGNLFSHLTVEENMLLQIELARKGNKERVGELLSRVGLGLRRNAYASELSGGEAARAGLAVALSAEPDILLADEPTGEVDGETERHIIALFHQLRNQGTAIVMVTHSEQVARNADRIVRLEDGRVLHGTD